MSLEGLWQVPLCKCLWLQASSLLAVQMARLNTDPTSGAVKPSAPVPSRAAAKPATTFNPRSGQPFDAILAQAAASGQAQAQVHAAGVPTLHKPSPSAGLTSPIKQLFSSAQPAQGPADRAASPDLSQGDEAARESDEPDFDWHGDGGLEGPASGDEDPLQGEAAGAAAEIPAQQQALAPKAPVQVASAAAVLPGHNRTAAAAGRPCTESTSAAEQQAGHAGGKQAEPDRAGAPASLPAAAQPIPAGPGMQLRGSSPAQSAQPGLPCLQSSAQQSSGLDGSWTAGASNTGATGEGEASGREDEEVAGRGRLKGTPVLALPPASQLDAAVLDALPLPIRRELERAYGTAFVPAMAC